MLGTSFSCMLSASVSSSSCAGSLCDVANVATVGGGGAISAAGGLLLLTDVTASSNSAAQGGGLLALSSGASANCSNLQAASNAVSPPTSMLFSLDSELGGGAIWCTQSSTLDIHGGQLSTNGAQAHA